MYNMLVERALCGLGLVLAILDVAWEHGNKTICLSPYAILAL